MQCNSPRHSLDKNNSNNQAVLDDIFPDITAWVFIIYK